MTMITPNRGMPYTIVPLNRLDEIRQKAREEFGKLPDRYVLRTFYIGPRAKKTDMHVLKARAIGAKVGIYKIKEVKLYSSWWNNGTVQMKELIGYV